MIQLRCNELSDFCSSESLSEEGLLEVIERYKNSDSLLSKINGYNDDYSKTFTLLAYGNENITEGIARLLLTHFPKSARATDSKGGTPLHYACNNRNVTPNIVKLLIDVAPDTVRHIDSTGLLPLHLICESHTSNINMKEQTRIAILKLLLEKYPDSARIHTSNFSDMLPIHIASLHRSPEFCRLLLDAYPGSERIRCGGGVLPLHIACRHKEGNSLSTIKYLCELYPDAINQRDDTNSLYPIHFAFFNRKNLAGVANIVKFLYGCDPNVKLQKARGTITSLNLACCATYDDSNIEDGIEIIGIIYDAYPEALDIDTFTQLVQFQSCHEQVQTFINQQLNDARRARTLSRTPERAPILVHIAIRYNTRLGSIKLLVQASLAVLRVGEVLPIQVACEHHDSADVVEYLLDLDAATSQLEGEDGAVALHYACRGAKFNNIVLLLEKCDASLVSKRCGRDRRGKLPLDELITSTYINDRERESIEYTDCIYRLLRAYPEMEEYRHSSRLFYYTTNTSHFF